MHGMQMHMGTVRKSALKVNTWRKIPGHPHGVELVSVLHLAFWSGALQTEISHPTSLQISHPTSLQISHPTSLQISHPTSLQIQQVAHQRGQK